MSEYLVHKIDKKLISDSLKIKSNQEGAISLFLGNVRADTLNGQYVTKINYTAYTKMAEKVLRHIERKVTKKYKLSRLIMKHCIGDIKAGESSLLVCAASSHRKNAFQAVADAVKMIKQEVPVWKKEFYRHGACRWLP